MADVRILPEIISNRIAAGEVVERPVSVVKELVENALDANASRIIVEVEKGGRSLIRVSDDGDGMNRDNALLSIERYATSKIAGDEDLLSIRSLGFRGEALPSIASISKLTIITREKGSDTGTRIHLNGGRLMDVSEVGAAPGTIVEVRDIFFNTPARRKFLKTINTEMGHIADAFSTMSLGYPHIQFRLIHNQRLVRHFPISHDLRTRAGAVLANENLDQLYPVDGSSGGISVTGYIGDPKVSRSTAQKIQLFVNGRMVTDRGVVAAIQKGYSGRLMKGRYPLAILFIKLPFDQVDVNVHPAKLQVRFADHRKVFSVVADGVLDGLQKGQANLYRGCSLESAPQVSPHTQQGDAPSQDHQTGIPSRTCQSDASSQAHEDDGYEGRNARDKDIVAEKTAQSLFKWGRSAASSEFKGESAHDYGDISPIPTGDEMEERQTDNALDKPYSAHYSAIDKTASSGESLPMLRRPEDDGKGLAQKEHKQSDGWKLSLLGQVLGTYIVAGSWEGLVVIDQHAAHERVVYEELKRRSLSFKTPSQNLIVPEMLELSFKEAELMERIAPELGSLGIKVEPFGGTTFVVKSVPAIIDDRAVKPIVLEILDRIEKSGIEQGDEAIHKAWLDDCLILMACHSAVRARHALSSKEMENLITALQKCDNPFHCPHGRPTMIRWDERGLEKLFKRVL